MLSKTKKIYTLLTVMAAFLTMVLVPEFRYRP